MCIRDRVCVDCESRTCHVPASDNAAIIDLCKPSIFQPLACLLYTSDAADERSSVDLGGRRIIKKKQIDTTVKTTK